MQEQLGEINHKALRKLRQEDHEFEASLNDILRCIARLSQGAGVGIELPSPTCIEEAGVAWLEFVAQRQGSAGTHVSVMSCNACLSDVPKVLRFGTVCDHEHVCTTPC